MHIFIQNQFHATFASHQIDNHDHILNFTYRYILLLHKLTTLKQIKRHEPTIQILDNIMTTNQHYLLIFLMHIIDSILTFLEVKI